MISKASFGDPDYHPIWSNLSWEKTPRLIVVNVTKLIPKAGGVISAVIDKMWPKQDPVEALIEASETRMKDWVNGEFEAYERKQLTGLFDGLRRNIQEYVNATEGTNREQKGAWMDNCLTSFNTVHRLFTNPMDHVAMLPLVRELAFAHIEFLRDRLVFADDIYGPGTNKAGFASTLTEMIKTYQEYFLTKACPAVMERRRGQISIANPEGLGGNPYVHLIDTGRGVKTDVRRGDRRIAEQYQAYYLNEIDIDLQQNMRDVAEAWALRDPSGSGRNPIPKDRVVWIGPVGISLSDVSDNQHGFPLNMGRGNVQSPVVNILLKHGVILDFIYVRDGGSQFTAQGKRRGLMVGNDKGGIKAQLQVPEGHYIQAVDTYWNYACMAIEFHYTNGTSSGRYGLGDKRPARMHRATYGGDHVLQSMAIHGSVKGISEFHFGFMQDPRSA